MKVALVKYTLDQNNPKSTVVLPKNDKGVSFTMGLSESDYNVTQNIFIDINNGHLFAGQIIGFNNVDTYDYFNEILNNIPTTKLDENNEILSSEYIELSDLDSVLDKINDKGMNTLTQNELKVLTT